MNCVFYFIKQLKICEDYAHWVLHLCLSGFSQEVKPTKMQLRLSLMHEYFCVGLKGQKGKMKIVEYHRRYGDVYQ